MKQLTTKEFIDKIYELEDLLDELFNEATYHQGEMYSDFIEIVCQAFDEFKEKYFEEA